MGTPLRVNKSMQNKGIHAVIAYSMDWILAHAIFIG